MSHTVDRTHGRLLVVVGVLLVGTLAAMVVLWPRADRLPEPEPFADDEAVTGVVRSVETWQGEPDPFMETDGTMLSLEVEFADGPESGRVISLDVDPTGYPEFSVGDRLVITPREGPDGETEYFISDFQRLPALAWLVGLFVLAVLVIGRWHGLRSLLGLALSLLIVIRFIVPSILVGNNPPLVALVGALAIMIVTLYLTHGVNEMTTSAVIGTSAALMVTVGLALLFISQASISGFSSDDAIYARFALGGVLDLRGLVLAGLIIAALGVLDDVTVSQASTVFALHDTDRRLPWAALFARAMRVGRDHIASVVNTLFLAYAGASLALLVLFTVGGGDVLDIVNSEVFAEEVVKIVVGSLGLIAAVPFTTALAAAVAVRRDPAAPPIGGGHLHSHTAVSAEPDVGRGPAAAPTRGGPERSAPTTTARREPARPAETGGAGGPRGGGPRGGDLSEGDLSEEERARRAWLRYLDERLEGPPEPPTRP